LGIGYRYSLTVRKSCTTITLSTANSALERLPGEPLGLRPGQALQERVVGQQLVRDPTMFVFRNQAQAGGLLAYAAKVTDLSRRAAFFVDRILRGARRPTCRSNSRRRSS
jgi:hypothetical protein